MVAQNEAQPEAHAKSKTHAQPEGRTRRKALGRGKTSAQGEAHEKDRQTHDNDATDGAVGIIRGTTRLARVTSPASVARGAADTVGITSSTSVADAASIGGGSHLDKRVPLWIKAVIGVALSVIVVVSFSLGRYPISPPELVSTLYALIVNALTDGIFTINVALDDVTAVINAALGINLAAAQIPLTIDRPPIDAQMATALMNLRLPRILVVMLVGAALSVAGASYQGMFKNPLVSPDILGASAGASFGACLALLLDLPNLYVQLFAFVGAMVAVGGAVWMNKALNRYDAMMGLVLGGMLISSLFQSFVSLIKFMADANDKLPAITFWLMGSFSRIDQADFWMVVVPILAGFALLMLERWKLNVLSFGEDEAKSLGINTARVRTVVIFASTLVVACSVAVSGIVGWVGLVIPHLARAIVGPNYRVLLPTSMFIGAGYLLIVDNVCRLLATVEIPIGILTAIIGVPFFIFIFRRNQKGW